MADNTSANDDPVVSVRRNDTSTEVENASAVQRNEGNGNDQQPQPEPVWKTIIYRLVTFWVIMQVIKSFTGKKSVPATENDGSVSKPNLVCHNLFKTSDPLELYLFYSESPFFAEYNDTSLLMWHIDDLIFGGNGWYDGPNQDGTRILSGNIEISEKVKNNGSLYYHVYFVKKGYSIDPSSKYYSRYAIVNQTKEMISYRKQRIHKTKNLLTGEADTQHKIVQTNASEPAKIISYWHPNLTLNILDDQTPWQKGAVPSPIDQYIMFDKLENFYRPVVYFNDYWNYVSDYMPVNDTTPKLEYNIVYSPISMFKWQLYVSQSMRSQWNQYLGDSVEQTDSEQDMIKRTLQETNPYLLGLTMVVSLVHSVFEFLAFKNDIQFWKTRKTLEGLSVRSIFFNVFQSLVVLLYVLDNETNMIVVFSCFVGMIIECWKITKVVDISIDSTRKWGPFPAIAIKDKSTYVESSTKEYDRLAFRYLSWLLFPLLGCYAVYSLLYVEHKGWYSFVLSIAYGFLLTFGFIMMTPQLFINYKLKSIAHLPWRMLTYKALNTFIDDIFAFVIKMPTLYRIGCLRDDVIFFIYLYQKYIYPIDHSRVNEFGTSGEDMQEEGNEAVVAEENKKDK
ncbi:putative lipid scramblase CLPTM1 [Hydractinia symbiolongicarpus]|uniref:putative lipid scramblase CLPTM1 n=1 Tax=Hydractinia symbiolongicarpus TaxID=13093 RepID=UPI00254EDCEF|nr:putative lipid scramblase CLPTM1 [Hydractinia symbiolongicarpus]